VNIVHRLTRHRRVSARIARYVTLLSTPQSPGTARLTFTRAGTHTVLTRAFATAPAKLIETNSRSTTCWVYAATLGGGLVGGDDIQLTAEVMADAQALLTTQASTKVYRSPRQSRQSVTACVGAHALLAVLPDPVVCFADADFVQRQRYDLAPDASLVMMDWMTSGRHAAGERWQFARYESRIDVRRCNQPVVFDGIVLEPNLDRVADRMGRFEVVVTAVLTGPLVSAAIDDIAQRVDRPVTHGSDLVASVARLRDGGALVRMAGVSVEHIGCTLREHFAFLSPLIGDDLWSRKW